jgi:hypothetical protein
MSDLSKLDRGDLNTVAAALGVPEPEKLANKDEVAQAILGTRDGDAANLQAQVAQAKSDLQAAQEAQRTAETERDGLAKQLGERDATIAELNEQVAGPQASEEERPIERKTTIGATPGYEDHVRTWWCPFCDHGNGGELTKCGGCGAVRDEDTETATRRTFED